MKIVRCIVVAHNSNGEPDLYFCRVRCTQRRFEEGHHYKCARLAACSNGYGPTAVVFDEYDSAGKAMLGLFVWDSANQPATPNHQP